MQACEGYNGRPDGAVPAALEGLGRRGWALHRDWRTGAVESENAGNRRLPAAFHPSSERARGKRRPHAGSRPGSECVSPCGDAGGYNGPEDERVFAGTDRDRGAEPDLRIAGAGRALAARYFRDRQAEEFAVVLRPDGSLHSFHHVMAEDAPGASLTKEEAIRKGETYLKKEKAIDLAQWKLVEATSDKRPHRVDYTLTWQANRALDEDPKEGSASDAERAHERIELQVLGDEATSFRTYIKIPEEWRRKHEELSLGRVLLSWVLPVGLLLGGTLTVLVLFLKNLKSEGAKSIPWRRILWWSGWGLAAYAAAFFLGNRIPALLAAYDTAIPLKAALGILAVGFVVGGPLYVGLIALLFGMAWYFALGAMDRESLPAWAKAPGAYYRDALLIGIGGAIGFAGLMRLLGLAGQLWPTAHRLADASFGQDLDAILPAGAVFASSILRGLVGAGLICAIAAFIVGQAKRPWLRAL